AWAVAGFAVVEDERDRGAVIGAFEVSGLEGAGVDDWHRFDLLSQGGLGDHVPGDGDEEDQDQPPQAQRRSCRAASSWSPAVDERCIRIAVRLWKAAPIRKAAA